MRGLFSPSIAPYESIRAVRIDYDFNMHNRLAWGDSPWNDDSLRSRAGINGVTRFPWFTRPAHLLPYLGPILDSRSIHTHTYVRPVKFYGSGCPERFLDYTHLKKIPHESLQHRRVFTRRLHFSDVSVNSPLSTGVHESLSGVVDAKGLPLELCARSAGLQRGACLSGSRWMTACPTTRNDTLGIIRLIIFRRAAPPFSSLCFTIFVHHFNLNWLHKVIWALIHLELNIALRRSKNTGHLSSFITTYLARSAALHK